MESLPTSWLRERRPARSLVVGDLVIAELLHGCRDERAAAAILSEFSRFLLVEVAGTDIAIQAARNYRLLRANGITVRKTIATRIATRCITEGWSLLHRDRDYEPFVTHLGLRPAIRVS